MISLSSSLKSDWMIKGYSMYEPPFGEGVALVKKTDKYIKTLTFTIDKGMRMYSCYRDEHSTDDEPVSFSLETVRLIHRTMDELVDYLHEKASRN